MSTALFHVQATTPSPKRTLVRAIAIAFGALALTFSGGAAQAQSHGGFHGGGGHGGGGWHGGGGGWHGGGGYYRGGGWGYGPFWGLGLGLGLGLATSPYYYGPDYVVVDRPAPLYYGPPAPVYAAPAQQATPAAAPTADPIFYPRNGQSASQVEADRQACNRWATGYPQAMNDASVFQRATLACMDGHGYTSR
jgi:hypothetical protein